MLTVALLSHPSDNCLNTELELAADLPQDHSHRINSIFYVLLYGTRALWGMTLQSQYSYMGVKQIVHCSVVLDVMLMEE